MRNITIGILGGMGPRATVEFEMRLLDRFAGSDQNIPKMITINEGAIPDRTAYLLGKGANPVLALQKNLDSLRALGADIICMPCNTAHADKILGTMLRDDSTAPIVDMPLASLIQAMQLGSKTTLILGTEGTRSSHVFDLRTSGKIGTTYPDIPGQHFVSTLIADIKKGATIPEAQIDKLQNIIRQSSADSAILACTELSLLKSKLQNSSITAIDSLDALADSCVLRTVELYNKRKGETHDTRLIYA